MNFKINLGEWGSVFAVPSCVVDKHIKLAGGSQIKVLLWMLRHSGENIEEGTISKALSMHPADVKDAMHYWVETGVLSNSKDEFLPRGVSTLTGTSSEEENHNDESLSRTALIRPITRRQKPNNNDLSERITKDKEIAFLMQEAQVILGRPISSGDSAILLMIHDNDGLPVDVIIMLLQYAVSVGKANMNYIEKVAISWGVEEICSVQKAEEKLKLLSQGAKAWHKVENVMGIDKRSPTSKESEFSNRWVNEFNMNEDLLREAYERCINAKGKLIMSYIDSIIKRWHTLGIKNISQAKKENERKEKPRGNSTYKAAYNIEEYDSFSAFD